MHLNTFPTIYQQAKRACLAENLPKGDEPNPAKAVSARDVIVPFLVENGHMFARNLAGREGLVLQPLYERTPCVHTLHGKDNPGATLSVKSGEGGREDWGQWIADNAPLVIVHTDWEEVLVMDTPALEGLLLTQVTVTPSPSILLPWRTMLTHTHTLHFTTSEVGVR